MPAVEVAVVGGGPAGAAAAIALARSGIEVLVVDKARFPRDKCCGDGLTAAALRLYETLGVTPDTVGSWNVVDDVVVRSPSGRTTRFSLPRHAGQYAAVARRVDLDGALLDQARAAGADVRDDHAVLDVALTDGGARLEVGGIGAIAARFVVAADGMWSPVRRALGLTPPGYLGDWHAFRQYFTGAGPQASDLWVFFEPDLLPGYAWSFPLPHGAANVGFGVPRTSGTTGKELAHLWRSVVTRPHIAEMLGPDATTEAAPKAWPIPAGIGRLPLSHGPVLFVGDAAAAPDPMTGEGIAQAIATALEAASAIAEHRHDPSRAGAWYERAVRRDLRADHRMSSVLGRVLRSPVGARGALRVAGASEWTRRHFARWLFEDYPRAAVFTPRRWHRGMFHGPGAYRAHPS